MHLEHRVSQSLIKVKEGAIIYTSLRYRDDKKRRALGLLAKEGYYKKVSRFGYERTNKA